MDSEFPCPVCDRSFSKPADRNTHIKYKQDQAHQAYVLQQAKNLTTQLSNTVDAVSRVPSGTQQPFDFDSGLRLPAVQSYNVDHDDLPSSHDMEIDLPEDSGSGSDDEEASISSTDDVIVPPEPADEELEVEVDDFTFHRNMDEAVQELWGVESLDQVVDHFNFLPEPDLESAESRSQSIPGSAPATYRRMDRVLAEDETEPRTWRWHPTAGQVLGHETTVHQRWQALFSKEGMNVHDNGYLPFTSRLDWEIAQWAVKEKISQNSFDRLLQIPQVKDCLGLSYGNSKAMLKCIDEIPDRCGQWFTKQLSFKDRPNEYFTIHHRDPVEAIKALWGDPAFAEHLVYKPAKLFRGQKPSEEERMFSEMWTGGFWNAAQTRIPEGGTICPVIIASDKTQLTQFSGGKAAYPVYLTIGNIPKALRRQPNTHACVLIAYLSVDKPSDKKGLSKTALRLRNYEIFHRSMAVVLEPLKKAGDPSGSGIKMTGGDGAVRRVYPLLATYVADYPEQCLVTCTKYGTCPKCKCKADELELPDTGDPRTQRGTYKVIQNARKLAQGKSGSSVYTYSMEEDVAGGTYDPFWVGFPLSDIHKCIAPDILHQCYQGVFKHLVGWVQDIVGKDELDKRVQALPLTSGVRHFKNGISSLSQVSGSEHKHIARILLACLVGKMHPNGIVACRSLLHFIHLAQYPSHDKETLGYMKEELETWEKYRSYFIEQGPRMDFNIPKFHSLSHYVESIEWLGTTDNYNTEMFERLHIDFAKEGWRASNKRDHFPQMVKWLSRQEKVSSYDFYRSWVDDLSSYNNAQIAAASLDPVLVGSANLLDHEESIDFQADSKIKKRITSSTTSGVQHRLQANIQIAKFPHELRKSLGHIIVTHGAPGFVAELKQFLHSLLPLDQQTSKATALRSSLPFTSLEIWHQFKFVPINLFDDQSDVVKETVKAVPLSKKTSIAPRYDTVIVLDTDEAESTAVLGCRIARLKVIFRLPKIVDRYGFQTSAPSNWPTVPLAYVTWFTRFNKHGPDRTTGMYRVEPSIDSHGIPQGSIIPLSDIRQSCMLVPSRTIWDQSWTSDNILDHCQSFFVNNLQSKYTYQTIY